MESALAANAEAPGRLSAELTDDERRQIVRQARTLLEQLYVHLPLKRAMHAVDPIQRLRLLERRLGGFSDRGFHEEMLDIFTELRDLHTAYTLPRPFAGRTAALPFRIELFWDGDTRRYLVSDVAPGQEAPPFVRGVEVTHWNGTPIHRAVVLNGERNGGSNPDARHARGLSSMTYRPMSRLAAPEEDWVTLSFLADGTPHEQRFSWGVVEPPPAPTAATSSAVDSTTTALGYDALTEEIRRAEKLVLDPEAIDLERRVASGEGVGDEVDLTLVSKMPDALEFRTVQGPRGNLGYLRIRTFLVKDPTAFVTEVVRILGLLPQGGLIIDVRGNGGGAIPAAERLLQLLTPRRIEPEPLGFLSSQLTLRATAAHEPLAAWRRSIEESVETGSPFSDSLPLDEEYPQRCNAIGQRYFGPVALITSALCYSATDIFAAGFQDHEIGLVVGTSGNTGAGGANVWSHKNLREILPDDFKPLPKEASLQVAIRRMSRVGKRAGDPLEDLGVVSDRVHRMTRRDLLERNVDLIAAAGQLLSEVPRRVFEAEVTGNAEGTLELALRTEGIDRIDVFVDDRPRRSLDVVDGTNVQGVSLEGTTAHAVELRGFERGKLVAARRLDAGV